MFSRPSCLAVYAESPWGAPGLCENVQRGIWGAWAAVSSSSLGGSSGFLRPQTYTPQRGAGDCKTLSPLQKLIKVWKGTSMLEQEPALPGRNPVLDLQNTPRFSCAPVLMKKEQCGQTGPATLPILTFSSPKLDVPEWFFAGFSLPAWVSLCPGWWCCATSGWAPGLLPMGRPQRFLQAGQGLVSRRCKPCLVPSCTSLSPG